MPLWSGVLLGRLERYQEDLGANERGKLDSFNQFLSFSSANAKSEGYIEGAMRNLKEEDFPGKKHLRADTFVSENYTRIRRRLRDYGDRLHGCIILKVKRTYQKKTKKEDGCDSPSSTVESISSLEENYHDAHEKWGKKDPETPKQNPKLGQFQQSPMVPLSKNPDFKTRRADKKTHNPILKTQRTKTSKNTNACSASQHKPGRTSTKLKNFSSKVKCTPKRVPNNKRKRKPRMTTREKSENIRKLTEWIYKHDADKDENGKQDSRAKRRSSSPSPPRSNPKKFNEFINSLDDEEKDVSKFVGLQNRSNSCWLNTLVQCINSLPQQLYLLDERKKNTQCKVTSALLNVISKMDYSSNKTFHPSELYKAMQDEYNLTAGEQQDIQEMFTFLCSTGIQNMNDIIASQFQTGCQFRKTCKNCGMYEDNSPETPTTILVPVLHGIQDLERSIENTMIDHISIHCSYCNDVTDHTRFVFLPQTLVVGFDRFEQKGQIHKKNHSKVVLPLEIELTGNTSL